MRVFGLSDIQAEAVLNLRLRALHKLEEMELQREHQELSEEKDKLLLLLSSDRRQWTAVKGEIKSDLRTKLEDKAPELLKRRTIGDAPVEVDVPVSALIDKEPITVVLSKMG